MVPKVFSDLRLDLMVCRDWKLNQIECPESDRVTALLDMADFVVSRIVEVFELSDESKEV